MFAYLFPLYSPLVVRLSGPQVNDSFFYDLRCTLVCFLLYYSSCPPGNFSNSINFFRRFSYQRLMYPFKIVKLIIIPLTLRMIPEQFKAPPEISFNTSLISKPLYEDVIHKASLNVHIDLNTMIF